MLLANGQQVKLAPQALAELVPQTQTGYYYPESMGLDLERQFAWYGQIYKAQTWVRTVVDKRANSLARLNIQVWDERDITSRTLDTTSPYAKLLQKPCYYLDSFTFWAWVASTVDIYGETYLAIECDESGRPVSLNPMHPSRVAIKRDFETGRYLYTFQAGAGGGDGMVQFDEDQVVPFRLFNPLKTERGLSKMESLKSTIMSEDSSRNATSAMWVNAGRPTIALSTDKKLSDDGRRRLKQSFDSMHAGSSNAGKALVLEDGLTATPIQLTAVEMQWIESRKLNREEIAAAYDIAPTMIHILDHATFSNISAQMRAFYRDTMAPFIEFIESVLDTYVGGFYNGRKVARFAVDDVIRGDWEHRSESGARAVAVGGMTPNEFRHLLGFNKHSDPMADKLYANSAIQPLGTPAEQIRLMGNVSGGPTPDGTNVVDPLAIADIQNTEDGSNPVPGGDAPGGNPGHSTVPNPRRGAPVSIPKITPNTLLASARKDLKHLRTIKGAVGRGNEIKSFAMRLAAQYPDDLEDILAAVQIAIAERDR